MQLGRILVSLALTERVLSDQTRMQKRTCSVKAWRANQSSSATDDSVNSWLNCELGTSLRRDFSPHGHKDSIRGPGT